MKPVDEPASFRDPSGTVFYDGKRVLRVINPGYRQEYDLLMSSGLYQYLADAGQLIPHREPAAPKPPPGAYKVIEPEIIPFISYPYEWSFGQLQDAALLTLSVARTAIGYGMSLKDATSFNIQFYSGKPILIDTLSFEKYDEGRPWVAYRQFCEQFLAPLALAAYTDIRLNGLLLAHVGSVPLDLAAKLLPWTAKIRPAIAMHIVLHARSQKQYADKPAGKQPGRAFGKQSFLGLLDNLESAIRGMAWQEKGQWTDYAETHVSYEDAALVHKQTLVSGYLDIVKPKTVWDIGANTGEFTRIATGKGAFTISMDIDPTVVERNYRRIKKNGEPLILPLWMDITNPTPAIGWENRERAALLGRPHPDTVMALALIHHLAIGNNVPLPRLAAFFAGITDWLIIEFVPKDDPLVRVLLASRQDIFDRYTRKDFETEFGRYFTVRKSTAISRSKRVLYLMQRKRTSGNR